MKSRRHPGVFVGEMQCSWQGPVLPHLCCIQGARPTRVLVAPCILLWAGRAAWLALTGDPQSLGHPRLGFVTRLLTPLPQKVPHSDSSPQGGESHLSPDKWDGHCHPDQAQDNTPQAPDPSPQGLELLLVMAKFTFITLLSVSLVN